MEGFSPRVCALARSLARSHARKHTRANSPAYGYNCKLDRSQVKVSDGAAQRREASDKYGQNNRTQLCRQQPRKTSARMLSAFSICWSSDILCNSTKNIIHLSWESHNSQRRREGRESQHDNSLVSCTPLPLWALQAYSSLSLAMLLRQDWVTDCLPAWPTGK